MGKKGGREKFEISYCEEDVILDNFQERRKKNFLPRFI